MASSAARVRDSRSAEPQQARNMRVIEGSRSSNPALAKLPAQAVTAFKLLVAVVFVFSIVCGVRIALSAATVEALTVNSDLEVELEEAVETGSELEIQRSILTSSDRIQKKARALGMTSAADVEYLTVDVDDGTPSISKAIASAKRSAKRSKRRSG